MPTKVQVKVNTIGATTRGNSNMVEMTGLDFTNNRGFKKMFFETTRDGRRTKNAEVSDTLQKDDWVEITLDDTSYQNVQTVRKIQEPSGGNSAPPQGGGGGGGGQSSGGGGGGGDKMSKEEWAEKDRKKELSIHRQSAVKQAIILASSDGKGATKTSVSGMEKLTLRIMAFLATGSFDGEIPADEPVVPEKKQEDDSMAANPEDQQQGGPGPEDDDIPF